MAFNVYVKSLVWLFSLGGIGYGLMLLTEPSEEKLQRIKSTTSSAHLTEDEKKKVLFMKRLKEAAVSEPIYMQKKDN